MAQPNRKMFYSMGEVSEMFDVKPSLIRFWEKKFDILKPHKNKKGNRLFTPADVENLKLIYHLSKDQGMKLDAIDKRLKHNIEGERGKTEILDRLHLIRSMLLEVKQELKLGGDVIESEVVAEPPKPYFVQTEIEVETILLEAHHEPEPEVEPEPELSTPDAIEQTLF